jgi:hypothetical protein
VLTPREAELLADELRALARSLRADTAEPMAEPPTIPFTPTTRVPG